MREISYVLRLPPTINHYYYTTSKGQRRMKPEAEAWMEEARWTIKTAAQRNKWEISKGKKIIMCLWAHWPDKRRRDMNNLHKALCDAPEGILYEDDKMVLVRDMDFTVDKEHPRVVVEIEEME